LTLYKYVSHKLIRWFSGYFLAGFALCVAILTGLLLGWFWAAALVLAVSLLGWLSLHTHIPAISPAFEAAALAMAVAYGVFLALRGEQFRTWVIAPSSRQWREAPPSSGSSH
jgi:hypothetical protein